jgi:hypothetical protein
MRKIEMVKKVLGNGAPCRKCARAEERLRARGACESIDDALVIHESQPASDGERLARRHGVTTALLFVIRAGFRRAARSQAVAPLARGVHSKAFTTGECALRVSAPGDRWPARRALAVTPRADPTWFRFSSEGLNS